MITFYHDKEDDDYFTTIFFTCYPYLVIDIETCRVLMKSVEIAE